MKNIKSNEKNMKISKNIIHDILDTVIKNEKIKNIDDGIALAFSDPCPIFYYNETNKLQYTSNPHLVTIGNLLNEINLIIQDSYIKRSINNNDFNILSRLQSYIISTLKDIYGDYITNGILSFLGEKIGPSILLFNINYSDIIPYLIDRINIKYIINTIIENEIKLLYYKNDRIYSIEEANSNSLHIVEICKDKIVSEIAVNLNKLIRFIVFGERFDLYGHRTNYKYSPPEPSYNDLVNGFKKLEIDYSNIDIRNVLFHTLSCEFTVQLSILCPLIEVLLWQVVAATDQIYSTNKDIILKMHKYMNENKLEYPDF